MRSRMLEGGSFRNQVQFAMPHSLIRSIQQGSISLASGVTSNTATLSPAVMPANSVILFTGLTSDQNAISPRERWTRVTLTNSTTVTASRVNATSAAVTVGWVVIEFYPGVIRQVQRSTITMNAATSGTYTISPALQSTAKGWPIYLGHDSDQTSEDDDSENVKLVLTNTTTLTASRIGANGVVVTDVEVVEFY